MKSSVKAATDFLDIYHLAVEPDVAICSQVRSEQEHFAAMYTGEQVVFDRPSILLAQIRIRPQMESTIIRWLENISQLQPSFDVHLNNFSGIPNHAVTIRILDKQPLQHILVRLASISEFINSSDGSFVELQLSPSVMLAAQLPEELYQKAIADYSKRTFTAQFSAQTLTLLRKEKESNSFQKCRQFHFHTPRFFAA
jgi:hypothetical protein